MSNDTWAHQDKPCTSRHECQVSSKIASVEDDWFSIVQSDRYDHCTIAFSAFLKLVKRTTFAQWDSARPMSSWDVATANESKLAVHQRPPAATTLSLESWTFAGLCRSLQCLQINTVWDRHRFWAAGSFQWALVAGCPSLHVTPKTS